MAKFTAEEKLRAAQRYLDGHDSTRGIANQVGVDQKTLLHWIHLYRVHGKEGLRKRYTNYTAEFKMDVLNFMNDTGASLLEAAAVFNIPSHSTVKKWKSLVDKGGMSALIPMKKGRPSMKEKPKKSATPANAKESLQEEVERLRMENAYLKKLNALVREKEASQRSSKRK